MVEVHGVVNAVTGLVAGAASMVTYTNWEAYIVLCPCFIISVWLNLVWRQKIGYDRPLVQEGWGVPNMDAGSLITALREARSRMRAVIERQSDSEEFSLKSLPDFVRFSIKKFLGKPKLRNSIDNVLAGLDLKSAQLPVLMGFLRSHHLFEDFCIRLQKQHGTAWGEGGTRRAEKVAVRVSPDDIFDRDPDKFVQVSWGGSGKSNVDIHVSAAEAEDVAKTVIAETAERHFCHDTRWLLEALGCYEAIVAAA